MGIRFLCQHCNRRLNVKTNQAGKQGKCPHCQGSIKVPDQSTISATRQKQTRHLSSQKQVASSSDSFVLDRPTPPESFGKIDPIAESPDQLWYFRSRTIGEKGPLKSKAMQEHVDRGDVTVGCAVWRNDWEDWVPAETAFPALAKLAQSQRQQARLDRAIRESNYQIPEGLVRPTASGTAGRTRLIIAVATLGGILIIGAIIATILISAK